MAQMADTVQLSLDQLVRDQRANHHHHSEPGQKHEVRGLLQRERPARLHGAQGKVGQQAGAEEDQRIHGHEIVCDAIDVLQFKDYLEQPDDRQADSHQLGRSGEDPLRELTPDAGARGVLGLGGKPFRQDAARPGQLSPASRKMLRAISP
jgi:hypothetical protein